MSPKNIVLLSIAAFTLISGSIEQYIYPGVELPPSAIWEMAILSILIFAWYRLDTDQLGYHRTPWLNVSVVAISIIALPYYFFRSRGAKRGFIHLGLFMFAIIIYYILSTAGRYAVYFALQS